MTILVLNQQLLHGRTPPSSGAAVAISQQHDARCGMAGSVHENGGMPPSSERSEFTVEGAGRD